jgi:uncharacterized protein YodC (DUF2158 family)
MEMKFKTGDQVYERVRPFQKLTVVNFLNGLYYCKIHERDSNKQLVYSENELAQFVHFILKHNNNITSV